MPLLLTIALIGSLVAGFINRDTPLVMAVSMLAGYCYDASAQEIARGTAQTGLDVAPTSRWLLGD